MFAPCPAPARPAGEKGETVPFPVPTPGPEADGAPRPGHVRGYRPIRPGGCYLVVVVVPVVVVPVAVAVDDVGLADRVVVVVAAAASLVARATLASAARMSF